MSKEKDAIDQSLKSLEAKQNNIDKLSKELDQSKKSMNSYYEARIKELEEKLVMINEERHKIESKTSEYNSIKIKEQELNEREKELN